MISFFRKIRKNLLNEGKTARYFKYALGEILLVVIGILIALQINNWNQEQNNRSKEQVYLNRLINDLAQQAQLLDEYIGYETAYAKMGQDVLMFYAQNKTFYDAIHTLPKLSSLTERRTFNPTKNTFEELIATGNIEHITNEALKNSIISYYHELERVTLVVSNNNTYIVDAIYQPEILKYVFSLETFGEQADNQLNQEIFQGLALTHLQDTSELHMQMPENELLLFNILQQRTSVAMGHIASYQSLQRDTTELKLHILSLLKVR